jgi:type VI secretion system secreted protein Hcp
MMKRKVFVLSLMILLGALPMFAAQYDAYMKIEGVDGESSAAGHQGWIDIESFSWGATPSAAGAGKCSVHDFHFTKKTDRASAGLAHAALIGLLIPAVTVELNGERHMLQNVTVKSVQNVNGDSGPGQAVALNFTRCATHEMNAGIAPGKKIDTAQVKAEIGVKGEANGTLALGRGAADAIALQDFHFNGANQAVLTCRKAGGGSNAILIGLLRASQTQGHIPELQLKAKKGNSPEYYVVKMTDVLVSSYQAGPGGGPSFDQITLNFAKLDGPMAPFHDIDIK